MSTFRCVSSFDLTNCPNNIHFVKNIVKPNVIIIFNLISRQKHSFDDSFSDENNNFIIENLNYEMYLPKKHE